MLEQDFVAGMSGTLLLGGLADLARLRDATTRPGIVLGHDGRQHRRLAHSARRDPRRSPTCTGPGAVRHIWMTTMSREDAYLRKSVLRMFWDGAATPCVEAPLGDFFGVGHGMMVDFWSLPLTMSPRDGRGFNCFFPMPFAESARIEVTNEGERRLVLYFYVDYETYPSVDQRTRALPRTVAAGESNRRLGTQRARRTRTRSGRKLAAPKPRRRGQLRHPRSRRAAGTTSAAT